ncbi:hypothetical protein FH972_023035 [Carpinus fangiana]|uniref:Uncharacterized protein n=1 Tax=Carpinus fangiana TaxID=176857 RepID=A0A5N6KUI4_9ROSI|nr:hypothetical protein FH972_023035 [Carpinus fangiana]
MPLRAKIDIPATHTPREPGNGPQPTTQHSGSAQSRMEKFSAFDRKDLVYKTVASHPIELTILTPKTLKFRDNVPVIVRLHGGFLFTGWRLFPDWCAAWLLDFAVRSNAIMVIPDYRLLPEATGVDILEDLRDIVKFLANDLDAALAPLGITADTKSTLVVGESAGGWASVNTGLLYANLDPKVQFSAIISAYGVLDVRSRFFTEKYDKPILGGPPMTPLSVLEDHKAAVKAGTKPAVSTTGEFERIGLALAAVQNGIYAKCLGDESELYPLDNLERAKSMPPLWLFHGRQDSAVPVANSELFAEMAKSACGGNTQVLLTLQDGEHGFDAESSVDTEWVKEGLEWLGMFWPAPRS